MRCHGHDLPGQNIVAHVCTPLCTYNECCFPKEASDFFKEHVQIISVTMPKRKDKK